MSLGAASGRLSVIGLAGSFSCNGAAGSEMVCIVGSGAFRFAWGLTRFLSGFHS
jgi:hypothetical protein